MSSFELSRSASAADLARESHAGKYLPLYLAGLAAGAGIGIALTSVSQGGDGAQAPANAFESHFAPFSETAPREAEAPAPGTASVALLVPGAELNALVELPAGLFDGLKALPVAVPVAAQPAPVVVQAPQAPAVAPVAAPAAAPVAAVPVAEKPAVAPAAAPAKPDFYVPEAPAGGITALESRLLAGINAERASAGLAPYTFDAGLSKIARVRVQQMVDQNYFGHVDPFGYSMYTELLAFFGYSSYAWAGENLALNNYDASESPERAIVALMKSPTHKANILAGDFFRVGIGELTTADGRHFFAMIFLG